MLIYSLPATFENFRCAIESRDEVPSPESLRVKILEESQARGNQTSTQPQDALFAKKMNKYFKVERKTEEKEKPRYRCFRCNKIGHKKADCRAVMMSEKKTVFRHQETAFMGDVNSPKTSDKWCLDCGATSHVLSDRKRLTSIVKSTNICSLNLADSTTTKIQGMGDVHLTTSDGKNERKFVSNKTLLVPDLRSNLMSVSKITDTGHEVNFKKNAAYITNNLGEIVVVAKIQGDLYYVKELQEETNIAETDLKYKSTLMTWHQKLGHLNEASLKEMQENGVVLCLKIPKNEKLKICEVCIKGKQTQNAFPHSERKSTTLLEIVHKQSTSSIEQNQSAVQDILQYLLMIFLGGV